ncbi:MAG: phosphoribosyltransferase [bacterium]
MKIVLNNDSAMKCLDNSIKGPDLYKAMSDFTISAYKDTDKFNNLDFDVIITILRAALPIGITLYQLTNKQVGFVSAIRQKDLSIEMTYKNIPHFKRPLIVDGWVASGNTIAAVVKKFEIKEVNMLALIASKQALELIKPDNYVIGHLAQNLTPEHYIIPPEPFRSRDGGNDMFFL